MHYLQLSWTLYVWEAIEIEYENQSGQSCYIILTVIDMESYIV